MAAQNDRTSTPIWSTPRPSGGRHDVGIPRKDSGDLLGPASRHSARTCEPPDKGPAVNDLEYDTARTALLVVDPYNDFISEKRADRRSGG